MKFKLTDFMPLEKLTLQCFDDTGKDNSKARIFSYDEKLINDLQKDNLGIYFCINPQIEIARSPMF